MTEMPDFPDRGAMEWRDDLKTYIDATVTRGTLPPGTDLDTLRQPEHAGVWTLSPDGGYANMPRTFASQQVLEVIVAGSMAIQRIPTRGTHATGLGVLWRQNQASAQWFPWQRTPLAPADDDGLASSKTVLSSQITKISTTTDPNEAAAPGELLIVLEA